MQKVDCADIGLCSIWAVQYLDNYTKDFWFHD